MTTTPNNARAFAAGSLLPCPFCGGAPEYSEHIAGCSYAVRCVNAGCEVEPDIYDHTPKQVRERWNKRVPVSLGWDYAIVLQRLCEWTAARLRGEPRELPAEVLKAAPRHARMLTDAMAARTPEATP